MNFAAVVVAMLSYFATCTVVEATKKSRACGMKHWPKCALDQVDIETGDFAVLPTSWSTGEDEDIVFSGEFLYITFYNLVMSPNCALVCSCMYNDSLLHLFPLQCECIVMDALP